MWLYKQIKFLGEQTNIIKVPILSLINLQI